jgi:hemerythrin-like domain-containing protein
VPGIKPIKRSEQLAPLSRDHHDGLLFAWKIKQGLKNGTDPEAMMAYVHWFWSNHLQLHFSQEEHLLLAHLSDSDELAQQLMSEHQDIKQVISGEASAFLLADLADKITAHIRFEERQLFPYIEQTITTDALNSIHKKLDQQSHCPEKWENEFWLKK